MVVDFLFFYFWTEIKNYYVFGNRGEAMETSNNYKC